MNFSDDYLVHSLGHGFLLYKWLVSITYAVPIGSRKEWPCGGLLSLIVCCPFMFCCRVLHCLPELCMQ